MGEPTSRALTLLGLLQVHRQWAGAELADRLGVTPRTLRRDVDRLRELGYRITAAPGVAGGYRLEAGERMPPLLLDDAEAIVVAVGLRSALEHGIAGAETTALSALAKFEQVLPAGVRERVDAVARSVPAARARRTAVSPTVLAALALVCRDGERVRFRYTPSDGAAEPRSVDPVQLVATARHWYLLAWDLYRDDWRTFRVDRIDEVSPTRARAGAHPVPGGDAVAFVERRVGAVLADAAAHRARVLLRMPIDAARAWFGAWNATLDPDADGCALTVVGATTDEIVQALAWLPPGVEWRLDASDEVRAAVAEWAARAVRAAASSGSGAGSPAAAGADRSVA